MAQDRELLIELVQKHPVLYDASHPDYKNKRIKNKVWNDISEFLGEGDGETLRKQWKNLRDCYSKHLRSYKASTKLIDRYKTWPWAKIMSFLRPHLELAEANINAQENSEEASFSQSTNTPATNTTQPQLNDLVPSQQNDTPQHIQRKRTFDQTSVDKIIDFLRDNTETDDDTDLLFKSYSMSLKKMSKRRQALVKYEIAKIMLDAEIEEANDMQHIEDNIKMVVKPPASFTDSDTNDTSSLNANHLSPLPPSPSYT